MLVGEFVLVLLDEEGVELGAYPRTATLGYPGLDQYIQFEESVFLVEDVVHLEDADTKGEGRVYMHAEVYARRVTVPDPQPRTKPRPKEERKGRVLQFAPSTDPSGPSALERLGAALAPIGLRCEATFLDYCANRSALLVRQGDKWLLQVRSPAELYRESRLAKQAALRALRFAESLSIPTASAAAA
jgi:hypothetical protein